MAVSALSNKKLITVSILISIARLCFFTGYAQNNPGQMFTDALICFNKMYNGCGEEYRLTQSGNINVPPEATYLFCNGPCVTETREVLNCINNVLSSFLFNNRATARDIRYAINAGCSNSDLRGNFNVERYIEGTTSSANGFRNLLAHCVFTVIISLGTCLVTVFSL